MAIRSLIGAVVLVYAGYANAGPVPTTVLTQQGLTLRAWYWEPQIKASAYRAVVMLHGCSGVYSNSTPNSTYSNIQSLLTEWGQRLSSNGYAVLLVDSYTGRGAAQNQCGNGSAGTDEVVDRAYDALAGHQKLTQTSSYAVDPSRVAVMGWSQGGSAAMSVMDISTWPASFSRSIAFYPGCGLYNAYGGVGASIYAPYSPLHILHGSLDPLYTSGYCQTRQQRAQELGSTEFKPLVVYPEARHSFDYCKTTSVNCSTADVSAKAAADLEAMRILSGM